jgi:hypothetical protein
MNKLATLLMCTLLALFSAAQAPVTPFGSTWSYYDNGRPLLLNLDPILSWNSTNYIEILGWKTGSGKFGYGGGTDVNTEINYGNDKKNKYVTTYFRKIINVTQAPQYNFYTVSVKRDDGVIVYLNGEKVFSNNLPANNVGYATYATAAGDKGRTPLTFTIDKSKFNLGINVIAAEVHIQKANDPDMAFDLAISADQVAPVVQSITRLTPAVQTTNSNSVIYRVRFSEEVTGVDITDFSLTKPGTLNGTIASISGSGNTYDVTVNSVSGNGELRLDVNASGTGIEDPSGNDLNGGFVNGQIYLIDQTVPTATGITRLSPESETTSATAVTFRVTFSEAVTGVDASDFSFGNTVTGTLSVAAGANGATYDVTVNPVSGTGTLDLDLNSSNTGIQDIAGNAISGGFSTGETYTIISSTPVTYGFSSITQLSAFGTADDTQQKPQSKAWFHDGKWWCAISVPDDPAITTDGGTYVHRLDGTTWTPVLKIFDRGGRADCWVEGNLVHILLFRGTTASPLLSIEYDAANATYKRWTVRPAATNLTFPAGAKTATLTVDGSGRLWAAADVAVVNSGVTTHEIQAWYSDAPYTSWSIAPVTIASGIANDDLCSITKLPGKIGIMWSNQNTGLFGFKTHTDGTDPNTWSADEQPGLLSVIPGVPLMADDHISQVVASDGTLYAAVKTSYNTAGRIQLGLLVRRPNGVWDPLHPVVINDGSNQGTQAIVILNETLGKIKVVYTTITNGGDIVYKESPTSSIAFGEQKTLISTGSPVHNFATSTHQTYTDKVVILATNINTPTQIVSVLASDVASELTGITPSGLIGMARAPEELVTQSLKAGDIQLYPNPLSGPATLSFTLNKTGRYTVSLYDIKGRKLSVLKQGWAEAGVRNTVSVDGSTLFRGLYLISVQTNKGTQVLKVIKK